MSTGFDVQLSSFFSEDTDRIVGILAEHIPQAGHRSMFTAQLSVWREEIKILKEQLKIVEASIPDSKSWHLIFEYELPRRQKRPDLIILTGHLILVVEFKIGPTSYDIASVWQALDYALNIRDFHEASAGHAIVPIVCIADAEETNRFPILSSATMIESPRLSNRNNLGRTIAEIYRSACSPQSQKTIDPAQWISSRYRPTLTIIEAAEHLYEDHDVREISHKYAENLDKTTDMLAAQIQAAKQNNKRCICFVTGVPGAGKTLTGLNVVHDPSIREKQGPAGIFLSGNGPLVKVVRESLIRSQQKKGVPKTKAKHEVSVFIRNVHEFLKYHRENPSQKPYEHVVVFDEAQRAWNREQMLRKQNIDCSEPSELLEVMERLDSWSAVIALVGGGQEIFTGEAGLEEWGMAIENAKEHWEIVASPEVIKGGSSVAGHRLFANEKPESIRYHLEESAHLNVSVRSHRAQQINEWVNSLLALDIEKAARHIPDPSEFPLVMTRNLELAKQIGRAHV